MGDFFKHIFDYASDKSKSVGKRTITIFFLIIIVLITDYHFNFSYNYFINNKTEQLISINKLKKIYKNDSEKLEHIKTIEYKIFYNKHYTSLIKEAKIYFFDLKLFEKSEHKEINNSTNKNEKKITNKPIRSLFFMTISSSYFFILLIIILLILPFKDKVHRELKNLLGSVVAIILLIGIIYCFTWVGYKIPLILNRPYLNYILNTLLHSPFLWIIYASSQKE